MRIGYIGLGKMGRNMVLRLQEKGIDVVAWNRSAGPREEIAKKGVEVAESIEELVKKVPRDRVVWIMIKAGKAVDEVIGELMEYLGKGDLIIDGGNSFYKDSVRRAAELERKGVRLLDVGVAGGPESVSRGTSLMAGGIREDYELAYPVLKAISAKDGCGFFGPHGAGHFVKMVHNGIEYGMMEAIAEGAAVLKKSNYNLDVAEAMRVYNRCSVIESKLVGWACEALREDPELRDISSKIDYTGEGEWTVKMARELGVKVPVLEEALAVRVRSARDPESFRNKLVSALRGEFGGHEVGKRADK